MMRLFLIFIFLILPYFSLASTFPRIANWYYKWDISDEKVDDLARYDLVIADMETSYYTPNNLERLKKINPDIILLAYISPVDIRKDAASLSENNYHRQIGRALTEHPEWILKQKNGEDAYWWPGNYIFNLTEESWRDYFVDFVAVNIMGNDVWDGVFYDNLWGGIKWLKQDVGIKDEEWQVYMRDILKKSRKKSGKYRDDFIISGNSGVGYYKYINGAALENFPDTSYGDWIDSLEKYLFILENAAYSPQFGIINANAGNTGNSEDYDDFRFGLASTLLGDGFYSYDDGDASHTQTWWYDEYNIVLGEALREAYDVLDPTNKKIKESVWRRDFTNGIVLVNSTDEEQKIYFEQGFEKIHGTQDPEVNDGSIVGSITLPAKDGIILLGRLSEINNTAFLNGSYAKVWNKKGKEKRQSFFPYYSQFEGGVKIIKIPEKDIIITAGETYVEIYESDILRQQFAPYGEKYKGGISLAAGKLYGGKKYYLVTGSEKYGSHIRIYDLKGNLKNPGCFAFSGNYGVSVTLGQLNKNKGLEIVAVPTLGGEPRVKILSSRCGVISEGFLAYKSTMRYGLSVAVGNINKSKKEEIVVAPLKGGKPQVRIFKRSGKMLKNFFAYGKSDTSGVLVGVTDIDDSGKKEIITNSFSIFK